MEAAQKMETQEPVALAIRLTHHRRKGATVVPAKPITLLTEMAVAVVEPLRWVLMAPQAVRAALVEMGLPLALVDHL